MIQGCVLENDVLFSKTDFNYSPFETKGKNDSKLTGFSGLNSAKEGESSGNNNCMSGAAIINSIKEQSPAPDSNNITCGLKGTDAIEKSNNTLCKNLECLEECCSYLIPKDLFHEEYGGETTANKSWGTFNNYLSESSIDKSYMSNGPDITDEKQGANNSICSENIYFYTDNNEHESENTTSYKALHTTKSKNQVKNKKPKGAHSSKNNDINIINIRNQSDKRTMVLLRHLSLKMTLKDLNHLMELDLCIDASNKNRTYDFIFFPTNKKTKKAQGCAYINFVNPLHIINFFKKYKKKVFAGQNKVCDIKYADFKTKEEIQKELLGESAEFNDTENNGEKL